MPVFLCQDVQTAALGGDSKGTGEHTYAEACVVGSHLTVQRRIKSSLQEMHGGGGDN